MGGVGMENVLVLYTSLHFGGLMCSHSLLDKREGEGGQRHVVEIMHTLTNSLLRSLTHLLTHSLSHTTCDAWSLVHTHSPPTHCLPHLKA